MMRATLLAALVLALSGCATGQEMKGSWFLVIARDGTCRQIVHEAKTEQLETNTTWRGEKCEPAADTGSAKP